MRLKLYCNRYGHFKDALVCSVNCVYRTRCNDFALFYDEHRGEVDALVSDYYDSRRGQGGGGDASVPDSYAPGRGRGGTSPDAASTDSTLARAQPVARPEELRKLI